MRDYVSCTPSTVVPSGLATVKQATDEIECYLMYFADELQPADFTERGLRQIEVITGGFFANGAEHDLVVGMAVPGFIGDDLADASNVIEAYVTINRAYGKVAGADITVVYKGERLGTNTASASGCDLGESVVVALQDAYDYKFGE